MHHQQCSQAVQAPLWPCTLVLEVSVLWMCPLSSLWRGTVCPSPLPFLNCGFKKHFSAAESGQTLHVRASPVNSVSLQHTNSCRPQALGAAWVMATSAGHTWDIFPRDGGEHPCETESAAQLRKNKTTTRSSQFIANNMPFGGRSVSTVRKEGQTSTSGAAML